METTIGRKRPSMRLMSAAAVCAVLTACTVVREPLTPAQRADIIAADRVALFKLQEPVKHPITLFEAMARALKYNLDHRLALLEKSVSRKELDLARLDLLPSVEGTGTYDSRNKPDGSNSFSLTKQSPSEAYSTGSDRVNETADLTTVWNVLDFGISVIQARQEFDRTLIAEENRRKAVHAIIQEVRATFWQAVGAQKLAASIEPVIAQARAALADARNIEREGLKPKLEILRFQRTLVDIVRQLRGLQHQLANARTEFAALINLPPGSPFQLSVPNDHALTIPAIGMTLEEMEHLALHNRPEVREEMYNARISAGDVRKAMLRMLPGLEFQAGLKHDGNSFTLHNQWSEAGTRIVWNLVDLIQGPVAIRLAKNKEKLAKLRRQALLMAVLTQTHLAYRQYFDEKRKLNAATEIDRIDQNIFKNVAIGVNTESQSHLEYIHAATAAIMSRLQVYEAYAAAQNAIGRIYVTLGVDLAPKKHLSAPLPELTGALRQAVMAWNEGAASRPDTNKDWMVKAVLTDMDESLIPKPPPKPVRKGDEGTAPPTSGDDAKDIDPSAETGISQKAVSREGSDQGDPAGVDRPEMAVTRKTPADEKPTADFEEKPDQPESPAGDDRQENPEKADQSAGTKNKKGFAVPRYFLEPNFFAEVDRAVRESREEPVKQADERIDWDEDENGGGKGEIATDAADVKETGEKEKPAASGKKEPVAGTVPGAEVLEEVRETLHNWLEAWSNREEEAFFSFYSKQFIPPGGGELEEWKKRMSDNLQGLTFIRVEADAEKIVWEKPGRLWVDFRQFYRSNRFRGVVEKTLLLAEEPEGWMIVAEVASRTPEVDDPPPGYALQKASVKNLENAEVVMAELRERGMQPRMLDNLDERGRLWYSVRIGWYRNKNRARLAAWRLKREKGLNLVVVPEFKPPEDEWNG